MRKSHGHLTTNSHKTQWKTIKIKQPALSSQSWRLQHYKDILRTKHRTPTINWVQQYTMNEQQPNHRLRTDSSIPGHCGVGRGLEDRNAFYWYQTFTLDDAAVSPGISHALIVIMEHFQIKGCNSEDTMI